MDSKFILEIKFLSSREKPQVNKIIFNNLICEVSPDTIKKIEIPSSFFEENESKNASIQLFNNSILINECILEIFKEDNYFYCFLDEKGYSFQLLFHKNQPKIKIPIYQDKYFHINEFDTNGSLNRKRFTFINVNFHSILIDESFFIIPLFIPDFKSYQFSIYDIKKKFSCNKTIIIR